VIAVTPADESRLAVLESKVDVLAQVDQRIEALVNDGQRRLEEKLDKLIADSMPLGAARSMARIWAFAAASFTGLVSTVVFIAVNF
jgi:hypothetical protein